jgi:hypothetical protein
MFIARAPLTAKPLGTAFSQKSDACSTSTAFSPLTMPHVFDRFGTAGVSATGFVSLAAAQAAGAL